MKVRYANFADLSTKLVTIATFLKRKGKRSRFKSLKFGEGRPSTSIGLQHTHTHTTVLLLFWNMSGTTRVSRYQKGKTSKVKTNLDLLEQEILSGNGICWALCKSAPHPRQPHQHPTTQFFTGQMPFLPPNQQRKSTEGTLKRNKKSKVIWEKPRRHPHGRE